MCNVTRRNLASCIIDFQRIVEDQVIRMNVPIHLVGADIAVGVKDGGGTVSQMRNDVEVVCLPKDLPEYLDLDISELELDGLMYLTDIEVPEGVEIPELAQEVEQVQPIVSIHIIKEEIIEEEVEEGIEGEACRRRRRRTSCGRRGPGRVIRRRRVERRLVIARWLVKRPPSGGLFV